MAYRAIPPDHNWAKKVLQQAQKYNELAQKIQDRKDEKKNLEKMKDLLKKIEDDIIKEKDTKIRRDFAFLVQLIEERHENGIFPPEIIVLQETLLGGTTGDEKLVFQELGSSSPQQQASPSQQPFDLQTIDLSKVDLINLERISPDQLEKSNQKCAYGDGEIVDEHGEVYGEIWRCKSCKTVYHENCLRVCLLTKGSCFVCDKEYLKQ
nr:hypothetical protein [Candidatus Sigynarchaeota archaeon]